eukprot:scaffold7.g3475.t1
MGSDCIDLTLSDQSAEQVAPPPRKRQRTAGPSSGEASEDDVVVVESRAPSSAADAMEEDQELGEDEDLVVLRVHGEVWNQDLPHSRSDCGAHAFSCKPAASNAACCAKCFCYVCDCPASECKSWGSGAARSDHANAHGGDAYYQAPRAARVRCAPPAAPPAARPASAGAGRPRGLRFMMGAVPAVGAAPAPTAAAQEQQRLREELAAIREEMDRLAAQRAEQRAALQRQRAAAPAPALAACTLTEMPDPANDPNLMELARLELRCKAVGDNTIKDMRRKLARHGFYVPQDPRDSTHGDRLSLENLLEKRYEAAKMVRGQGGWEEGESDVVRRPGAAKVPVRLKLKKLALPEAAVEPGPERVRKVTVCHYDGRARPTTYGVRVHKEATVEDIMAAVAPLAGGLAPDECFLPVNASLTYLNFNAVEPGFKVTDATFKNLRLELHRVPKPGAGAGPAAPTYAFVFHRSAEAQSHYHDKGAGPPTIVPLGEAFASGGPAAQRAVLGRVLDALAPLRKEGAPEEDATFLVKAGVELHRTGPYNASYASNGPDTPFATARPYAAAGRFGEINFRSGKLYLRIDWRAEHLENFDTVAWANPVVHESASPEAMKETNTFIAEAEAYAAQKRHAQQLPYQAIESLQMRCKAKQPGVNYPAATREIKPMTRASLDLRPATNKANEKNGTLVAHDQWDGSRATSKAARRRYLYNDSSLLTHPLKPVMDVLLWDHGPFKEMQKRIKEWAAKDLPGKRSLAGLMEVMERGEMPAAQQPAGLTVTMRSHQLQSLKFMLDCERGEGGFRRHFWLPLTAACGQRYWYSSLLGRAALDVPEQPWGGFCCEEMGLGKTIETLALVLANPAPRPPPGTPTVQREGGLIKSRATLVVCAVSLVGQWMAEAQAKLGGSLRMHMYHGQNRIKDPIKLATQFDMVVTTYATLNSDFAKAGGKKAKKGFEGVQPRVNFPPLGSIKWHRLVLDESHTVKNSAVGHSRASTALEADRRWMVTGTPVNTDIADLYGQFSVLKMSPFDNKNFFDTVVRSAYGTHGDYGNGCPSLIYALGQSMVRHTKKQVLGGEEVLSLPPKTEEDVGVALTEREQEMYREAHKRSKDLFLLYQGAGAAFMSKHLLQIMSLLLTRDLMVNDPLFGPNGSLQGVPLPGLPVAGAALQDVERDYGLVAPEDECAICIDSFEVPVVTPCSHWFCRECIVGVLQANSKCPLCRAVLAANQLRAGVTAAEAAAAAAEAAAKAAAEAKKASQQEGGEKEAEGAAEEGAADGEQPPGGLQSESNLQALLKELRAMRRRDSSAKALIFSQYVSTIEWLKTRLTEEGFGYRYISGSMPLKQRAKAINAFQQDPPTTVFLLSMRSGSVGINLTAANHVFLASCGPAGALPAPRHPRRCARSPGGASSSEGPSVSCRLPAPQMEPALNPALEEQAIGRSWRMGQQRTVTVKRFYIKGSVEERIMEVVRKRQTQVAGAGGAAGAGAGADSDGEGPSAARARHTNDLAGSIKADKQNLRAGELEDPELGDPRVPGEEEEEEEEEEDEAAWEDASSSPTGSFLVDEEEEEEAGPASRGGRRGGLGGSGGGGRGRGRGGAGAGRKRRAADLSDLDDDDALAAAEAEDLVGASPLAQRRGGRATRAKRVNYRELDSGLNSSDEEDEEGDEQSSPPMRQREQPRQREQQQEQREQSRALIEAQAISWALFCGFKRAIASEQCGGDTESSGMEDSEPQLAAARAVAQAAVAGSGAQWRGRAVALASLVLLAAALGLLRATTQPPPLLRPVRRQLAEGAAQAGEAEGGAGQSGGKLSCEESGMCSIGKLGPPYVGEVDSTQGFKKALAAAAFKKEVVLAAHGDISPDIGMNFVFSMWEQGLANVMVLALDAASCEPITRVYKNVTCVWSTARWPPANLDAGSTIWVRRYMLMARAARLGYNFWVMDTDAGFFTDPYKVIAAWQFYIHSYINVCIMQYLHAPPFKDIQFLSMRDGAGVINGGANYIHNAAPDGPAAWAAWAVADRMLRVIEACRTMQQYPKEWHWVAGERDDPHTIRLHIPYIGGKWDEAAWGKEFPPRGNYSTAFLKLIAEESGAPMWGDAERDPPPPNWDARNETWAFFPSWLLGFYNTRGSAGYWDIAFHIVALGGDAPLQHRKEAILRAHRQYRYWVADALFDGQIFPSSTKERPLPRVLALAPGLKVTTETENQYRDMLLSLARLAMRLGRVLAIPDPYCNLDWIVLMNGGKDRVFGRMDIEVEGRRHVRFHVNGKKVMTAGVDEGQHCMWYPAFDKACMPGATITRPDLDELLRRLPPEAAQPSADNTLWHGLYPAALAATGAWNYTQPNSALTVVLSGANTLEAARKFDSKPVLWLGALPRLLPDLPAGSGPEEAALQQLLAVCPWPKKEFKHGS